jgi:mono/diheme cytochrome c family protein
MTPGRGPARPALPLAAALTLAAACGASGPDDPKALRNLGDECVGCHTPGKKAGQWPFTAGGTLYRTATDDPAPGLGGVTITITDRDGKRLTLRSNRAGNFWTNEPLAFPVAVELRRDGAERSRRVRAGPCSSGACNACHARPPANGAPGRLWAPL